MRKLALLALLLMTGIAGVAWSEPIKTILNPFTGKFDYITKIDTNTIVAGSGVTSSCTNGVCTLSVSTQTKKLGAAWDGGGAELTTGTTYWSVIPASGTLTGFILTGLPSGSLTLNVSTSTFFNASPVSICGAQCPTFTTTTSSYNYTLGGWSKTLVKDSFLYFVLNAATTATQANVTLEYTVP